MSAGLMNQLTFEVEKSSSYKDFVKSNYIYKCLLTLFVLLMFVDPISKVQAQSLSTGPVSTALAGEDSYQEALRALSVGDQAVARRLLEQAVAKSPQHAGAWLDLALLYCELGDESSAYGLFERIEQELQAPPSIQSLIAKARAQGCRRTPGWMGQAQVALGHSTNVNYGPSSSLIRFAPSAPFAELFLTQNQRSRGDIHLTEELLWVLPAHEKHWLGAQWQVMVQARQHQSIHDFDSQTMAVGATWRGVAGASTAQALGVHVWEGFLAMSHWRLGGSAYESSAQAWGATWSNERAWGGLSWRFGYEGGVAQFTYPSNSVYDSWRLDARLRIQARWQALSAEQQVTLSWGPLWDQHIRQRPGGERLGYVLNAEWRANWQGRDQLVVYLQQQNMHEQLVYNPIFFGDVKRSPLYQTHGLRYQHALDRKSVVYLQWVTQTTKDSLEIFSYKNQQVNLGYQWSF